MEVVMTDAPRRRMPSSGNFSIMYITVAIYCIKKKGSVIT
jgi:hypothetical protein